MNDDPLVQDGTRRIVGRVALRRAAEMVHGWQRDEEAKHRLLPRLAAAISAFAVLACVAFFTLRPFGQYIG